MKKGFSWRRNYRGHFEMGVLIAAFVIIENATGF
jgi:hypothetical protein